MLDVDDAVLFFLMFFAISSKETSISCQLVQLGRTFIGSLTLPWFLTFEKSLKVDAWNYFQFFRSQDPASFVSFSAWNLRNWTEIPPGFPEKPRLPGGRAPPGHWRRASNGEGWEALKFCWGWIRGCCFFVEHDLTIWSMWNFPTTMKCSDVSLEWPSGNFESIIGCRIVDSTFAKSPRDI